MALELLVIIIIIIIITIAAAAAAIYFGSEPSFPINLPRLGLGLVTSTKI